jgi:hypothetical protein
MVFEWISTPSRMVIISKKYFTFIYRLEFVQRTCIKKMN